MYDRLPDVDGFIYDSHQLPSDCIVLVQTPPKDPKVFDRAGKARAVVDEPVRSLLNAEARRVKAVVDFGRLPYSANVACPSCRDSAAPGLLDWQTARRQRQPSALTPTGDSLPDRAVIFVTAEESK